MSVRILVGDVREKLAGLADESVHCVMTSPPYWRLRDYEMPGQIGLEDNIPDYIETIVAVFREVRRVLRPDGTLWLNMGDCYAGSGRGGNPTAATSTLEGGQATQEQSMIRRRRKDVSAAQRHNAVTVRGSRLPAGKHARPQAAGAIGRAWVPPTDGLKSKDIVGMPWRIAFALQADGWYLRSEIIWHKPNPMPESVGDRPTTSHEKLFLLARSEHYYYDAAAIMVPSSKDSHARAARGRSTTHKWADGGPGDQTIAKVSPSAGRAIAGVGKKIPSGWDTGAGDHRSRTGRYAQPRSNPSFNASVTELVHMRNARTVWTIATEPSPEKHFATYPTALVEPCILAGTSSKGVCPHCGAPWVRVLEKAATGKIRARANGGLGTVVRRETHGLRAVNGTFQEGVVYETAGWAPGCACYDMRYRNDFPAPRRARKRRQREAWSGRWRRVRARPGLPHWPVNPATVLDPFGGTGTTALVADRLGRNAILIELNPEYARMARARLRAALRTVDAPDIPDETGDDLPLFAEISS